MLEVLGLVLLLVTLPCVSRSEKRLRIGYMMVAVTKKEFSRLPVDVTPVHYNLQLRICLTECIFDGKESIDVCVKTKTSSITLNSSDLKIGEVEFTSSSGETVDGTCTVDNDQETAVFKFPQDLEVGKGQLKFVYNGNLNDAIVGLYKAKYTTPSGDQRYAAVTHFESCTARKAFPCWDEPAHKATFAISLQVPKGRTALSNMPPFHEEDANDGKEVLIKFESTPVMSTYLVAMIVGEFDYVEDRTTDGTRTRVYTPLGKKEHGRYALHVATKVLPYYKQYFGISYPLPKADLIAVPEMLIGAMENWGLVTFREVCLLVDPVNAAASQKQSAALVVGHELAHMWFGNLVTMDWWTDLWLKEGYAEFIMYMCVDHIFPDYTIWDQFVSDTLMAALRLDALRNSHPIQVPVGHPSEVNEIFDAISYSKGASIIRMLHNYLGDDTFKKGMCLYLQRHKYNNAETKDLWSALEEVSSEPIAKIMSTWTEQTGFPVIEVRCSSSGDSECVLSLKQKRFLADGSGYGDPTRWLLPVTIMTSHSHPEIETKFLLSEEKMEVSLKHVDNAWVKLNPGWFSYYRVQYPPDMIDRLSVAVKEKSLSVIDRLSLVDDVFALVFSGEYKTVLALKLLESYVDEDSYVVWDCICSHLARLSKLLEYSDHHAQFKKFVCSTMKNVLDIVGWDANKDESHLVALLREVVLHRLGVAGFQSVVDESRRRFESHVTGKVVLPADVRTPVYQTVMTHGDPKVFDQLLKLYEEASDDDEKTRITSALGATTDVDLLTRLIDFCFSDKVKKQDTSVFMGFSAKTKVGRELAWKEFRGRRKQLQQLYGATSSNRVCGVIQAITSSFCSEEIAAEIEEYFESNPFPGTERKVNQGLEGIRANAKWMSREKDAVGKFLSTF